jgi:hypothetical protein
MMKIIITARWCLTAMSFRPFLLVLLNAGPVLIPPKPAQRSTERARIDGRTSWWIAWCIQKLTGKSFNYRGRVSLWLLPLYLLLVPEGRDGRHWAEQELGGHLESRTWRSVVTSFLPPLSSHTSTPASATFHYYLSIRHLILTTQHQHYKTTQRKNGLV